MCNSVISTKGARYMCGDCSNFYLATPLERHQYMRIPIELIPQEIIDLYQLQKNQEWVCILWNSLWHVWTTRVRHPSQQITPKTARRTWIYRGIPHTWPFQALKQAHLVHINSRWLWSKIHWWRTRQTPNGCTQTLLQYGRGLEGTAILWDYPELELR